MKKTVLITFLGFLLIGAVAIGYSAQTRYRSAQFKTTSLPSINLLSTDSSTIINTAKDNTGQAKILVYFSPDCEHCQRQIEDLLKHSNTLGLAHLYLLTPMPLADLRPFVTAYHLDRYKNISVGCDYQYAFYKNYKATAFPCTAIFNSKKELLRLYRSEMSAKNIIENLQGQN